MKKISILLILLLFLTGCGSNNTTTVEDNNNEVEREVVEDAEIQEDVINNALEEIIETVEDADEMEDIDDTDYSNYYGEYTDTITKNELKYQIAADWTLQAESDITSLYVIDGDDFILSISAEEVDDIPDTTEDTYYTFIEYFIDDIGSVDSIVNFENNVGIIFDYEYQQNGYTIHSRALALCKNGIYYQVGLLAINRYLSYEEQMFARAYLNTLSF